MPGAYLQALLHFSGLARVFRACATDRFDLFTSKAPPTRTHRFDFWTSGRFFHPSASILPFPVSTFGFLDVWTPLSSSSFPIPPSAIPNRPRPLFRRSTRAFLTGKGMCHD